MYNKAYYYSLFIITQQLIVFIITYAFSFSPLFLFLGKYLSNY